MGWESLLSYMSLSLFIQDKITKGEIFMTALQKGKSNSGVFKTHDHRIRKLHVKLKLKDIDKYVCIIIYIIKNMNFFHFSFFCIFELERKHGEQNRKNTFSELLTCII